MKSQHVHDHMWALYATAPVLLIVCLQLYKTKDRPAASPSLQISVAFGRPPLCVPLG